MLCNDDRVPVPVTTVSKTQKAGPACMFPFLVLPLSARAGNQVAHSQVGISHNGKIEVTCMLPISQRDVMGWMSRADRRFFLCLLASVACCALHGRALTAYNMKLLGVAHMCRVDSPPRLSWGTVRRVKCQRVNHRYATTAQWCPLCHLRRSIERRPQFGAFPIVVCDAMRSRWRTRSSPCGL